VPGTVTTIDRDQRKGLYELVHNHLYSIEAYRAATGGWPNAAARGIENFPAAVMQAGICRVFASAILCGRR